MGSSDGDDCVIADTVDLAAVAAGGQTRIRE
jgi:hypothetical protein